MIQACWTRTLKSASLGYQKVGQQVGHDSVSIQLNSATPDESAQYDATPSNTLNTSSAAMGSEQRHGRSHDESTIDYHVFAGSSQGISRSFVQQHPCVRWELCRTALGTLPNSGCLLKRPDVEEIGSMDLEPRSRGWINSKLWKGTEGTEGTRRTAGREPEISGI